LAKVTEQQEKVKPATKSGWFNHAGFTAN